MSGLTSVKSPGLGIKHFTTVTSCFVVRLGVCCTCSVRNSQTKPRLNFWGQRECELRWMDVGSDSGHAGGSNFSTWLARTWNWMLLCGTHLVEKASKGDWRCCDRLHNIKQIFIHSVPGLSLLTLRLGCKKNAYSLFQALFFTFYFIFLLMSKLTPFATFIKN